MLRLRLASPIVPAWKAPADVLLAIRGVATGTTTAPAKRVARCVAKLLSVNDIGMSLSFVAYVRWNRCRPDCTNLAI